MRLNHRGSILMITLWILTILVIFTLSLGYRAAIELRLVRYQKDRLRANFLAQAAVNKAIVILKEDSKDALTKDEDTISACGVNLNNKEPQEFFSQQWDNSGEGFKIGYMPAQGEFQYGLRDEESRININGLGGALAVQSILKELFKLKNIDNYDDLAVTIVKRASLAPENAAIFKNPSFQRPEEIIAVLEYYYAQNNSEKKEFQKKAQEVYNKIKDLITVYNSENKININTASEEALTILARAAAGDSAFVTSLIQNIINLRNSENRPLSIPNFLAALTVTDERDIFSKMSGYLSLKSDYFRIETTAYVGNVTKSITVIYNRIGNNFLYWHEN